jgi:hypothetical protein
MVASHKCRPLIKEFLKTKKNDKYIRRNGKLTGRVAVVTGASKGIGGTASVTMKNFARVATADTLGEKDETNS